MSGHEHRPLPHSGILARILLGGGLVLFATEASAFKLKNTSAGASIQWMQDRVVFAPVPTGDGRRDALLRRALRASVDAWSRASALTTAMGEESENRVSWSGDSWDFDPAFLAVALTRYDVATGRIISAEIVINELGANWADRRSEPQRSAHFDLQNTLTHEVGHAVGLGHSEEETATMYASADADEVSKRTLARDDIEGVQALYGMASGPEFTAALFTSEEAAMGCSSTTGPGPSSWMVVLFAALLPWLGRRRRAGFASGALVLVLVLARGASASPASDVPPSVVLERAQLLFDGSIVSQHTEWRPGDLVLTISTIRIETCLKGQCPALVVVEQLGGEHGNLGLLVSGITPLPRQGRVLLATISRGPRWRLAAEDAGQFYTEGAKVGPSNSPESLAAVRAELQSYLSKAPRPALTTSTSTPSKGLMRQ